MIKPRIPENERERLQNLDEYAILDTLPEDEYDNITLLASYICNTPISLVSIIDSKRQWFKSHHGIDASETPRDIAFCAHAINDPQHILVVEDSRNDERFYDNPLVTGEPRVIFYAGVPLVNVQGYSFGTLCVIDNKPRELNCEQLKLLKSLSKQVVLLFELRKNNRLLEISKQNLEQKNIDIENFARVAAHDLKSPLNNMISIVNLLQEDETVVMPDEKRVFLDHINKAARNLKGMVDGILLHSRSDKVLLENKEIVKLDHFFSDLIDLIGERNCKYQFPNQKLSIFTNKLALQHIFINLITNSIKYCDKPVPIIELGFSETDKFYTFFVQDNGPGIKPENQEKIFNMFETLVFADKFGERCNGIGLSTVKRLVEGLKGQITIESEAGKGAKFEFNIPKP